MKWLDEKICHHVFGWTMPYIQVPLFDVVGNEEIPHVEVPHASGAGEATIFLEEDCTFVVLI